MTKSNFFATMVDELKVQAQLMQQEFLDKLEGTNYTRESVLPYLFGPTLRVRPLSTEGVTKNDINYTMWLIAELKGKLTTQLAHKDMQQTTFNLESYNKEQHLVLIGALQAETRALSHMLDTYALQENAIGPREPEQNTFANEPKFGKKPATVKQFPASGKTNLSNRPAQV